MVATTPAELQVEAPKSANDRIFEFCRRNPTVVKWQGKVVGGIYCALGVRLALQER